MTSTMTQAAAHTAAVSALSALLTAAITAPAGQLFPLDAGAISQSLTAAKAGDYVEAFAAACALDPIHMSAIERDHWGQAIAALYGASNIPA